MDRLCRFIVFSFSMSMRISFSIAIVEGLARRVLILVWKGRMEGTEEEVHDIISRVSLNAAHLLLHLSNEIIIVLLEVRQYLRDVR